jgi:uncharacterized protein with GYD domain
METYIILGNFTQEGASKFERTPTTIEKTRKSVESVGGKILSWYLTMGQYDFVSIVQVPDAKTAASLLLAGGAQGNSRTETMRALTEEEFKEVVASLP